MPKSIFGTFFFRCFFQVRFGIDFVGSMFGGLKPEKSTQTIVFFHGFCKISQNRCLRKSSQHSSILGSFSVLYCFGIILE